MGGAGVFEGEGGCRWSHGSSRSRPGRGHGLASHLREKMGSLWGVLYWGEQL